jgi:hypothetical protein
MPGRRYEFVCVITGRGRRYYGIVPRPQNARPIRLIIEGSWIGSAAAPMVMQECSEGSGARNGRDGAGMAAVAVKTAASRAELTSMWEC